MTTPKPVTAQLDSIFDDICATPGCKNTPHPADEFGKHDYCPRCEDRLIDRANADAEWRRYHE